MALLKKKKSKIKIALSSVHITDNQKKKYGVCEHNQVNYKTLEKLCKYQQRFIKSQFKKEEVLKVDQTKSNDFYIKKLKPLVKAFKDLRQKNTDIEIDFKVLNTDHQELQEYHKELVEKHELLESGRVKHIYKLMPKNKSKKKKELK